MHLIRIGVFALLFWFLLGSRAAAQPIVVDPIFRIVWDSDETTISYREAADLTLRFDRLADRAPARPLPLTEENLSWLIQEMVPMFEYEDFTDHARLPDKASIEWYREGRAANHTMGRSNCAGFSLNGAYSNPFNRRYGDEEWIATAVHELVHVQQGGICRRADRQEIESTAEIVSYELLAAQVNMGNALFLQPLLSQLRQRALSLALLRAFQERRLPEFYVLLNQIINDEVEGARLKKSLRYWFLHTGYLLYVLENYAEQPWLSIVQAIRQGDGMANRLALPARDSWYTYVVVETDRRNVRLDDLAYFLEHAEEIVAAFSDRTMSR